jgi:transcriptional regulator of acetoin/glycerol metabolism
MRKKMLFKKRRMMSIFRRSQTAVAVGNNLLRKLSKLLKFLRIRKSRVKRTRVLKSWMRFLTLHKRKNNVKSNSYSSNKQKKRKKRQSQLVKKPKKWIQTRHRSK